MKNGVCPKLLTAAAVCFRSLDTRTSRLTHRVNANQRLLVAALEQH